LLHIIQKCQAGKESSKDKSIIKPFYKGIYSIIHPALLLAFLKGHAKNIKKGYEGEFSTQQSII